MATSTLEIIDGGIQTTIQDYPGRFGLLARGFFPAGPMDHEAPVTAGAGSGIDRESGSRDVA